MPHRDPRRPRFAWTPIERAGLVLQSNHYVIGPIREDPDGGVLTFFDPATLRYGWNGPNVHGLFRLSTADILRLRHDPNAKAEIYRRVKDAEHRLLEDLG